MTESTIVDSGRFVVGLSGDAVLYTVGPTGEDVRNIEVRQYHRDYRSGCDEPSEDEHGFYEVVWPEPEEEKPRPVISDGQYHVAKILALALELAPQLGAQPETGWPDHPLDQAYIYVNEIIETYEGQLRLRYLVSGLEVVMPETLEDAVNRAEGISFEYEAEGSHGFPHVTIEGPSREAVIEFIREQWTDQDGEWFQRWVVDRVETRSLR